MKNGNLKCYCIQIDEKFSSYNQIVKELKNIYQMLKRICLSNNKYNDISFIIGISNTKSKSAKIIYVNNHKKGRPKKIILGEKIKYHFHIYVFAIYSPISAFCNLAKKRLARKYTNRVYLSTNANPKNALIYLKKQSNNIRKYGIIFRHTF